MQALRVLVGKVEGRHVIVLVADDTGRVRDDYLASALTIHPEVHLLRTEQLISPVGHVGCQPAGIGLEVSLFLHLVVTQLSTDARRLARILRVLLVCAVAVQELDASEAVDECQRRNGLCPSLYVVCGCLP